jgi:hypothetical protein
MSRVLIETEGLPKGVALFQRWNDRVRPTNQSACLLRSRPWRESFLFTPRHPVDGQRDHQVVAAYDTSGNLLASADPVQGIVNFSVASTRVPANSHTKAGISVVTAALGAPELARQSARHSHTAISRWLYRQSGAVCVGASIRNLYAQGMSLVTLTERDLQILNFSPGRIVLRNRVPLTGGLRECLGMTAT